MLRTLKTQEKIMKTGNVASL